VRFGIYGGSFDPIHRGHVEAASAVRAARGLAVVFLVPAAVPPHKAGGCAASFADRVAMARLAVAGRPGLEVLDVEGRRAGRSYTVDTLAELAERHPGADFDLLVGADMLEDLPRWHRAADLVAGVTVAAFARPGCDLEGAEGAFLRAFPAGRLVRVPIPAVEASSTALRRDLAAGAPVGDRLPPPVLRFIREKGLYGTSNGG